MKKLLMSVLIIGLAAAVMGGGVFAYFTDVETSENNSFAAGTLDIEIRDGNEGWRNSPVSASFTSPAGWAPGETFETDPVSLRNVGTIDIIRVFARFGNYVESDGINTDAEDAASSATNIGDFINVVSYSESTDGGANWFEEKLQGPAGNDYANAYLDYWNDRANALGYGNPFTLDGVISLADLVEASNWGSGDYVTALCMLDGKGAPVLAAGETGMFRFKFKLDPSTTNAYQGDTATFDVNFIANHIEDYPDDLLFDSITETLVTNP